jgi:hypothetical protein
VNLDLALYVVSLVLLALAALSVPANRFSLGWAGLFFFVLAAVV